MIRELCECIAHELHRDNILRSSSLRASMTKRCVLPLFVRSLLSILTHAESPKVPTQFMCTSSKPQRKTLVL
jgi:hypothetical protein